MIQELFTQHPALAWTVIIGLVAAGAFLGFALVGSGLLSTAGFWGTTIAVGGGALNGGLVGILLTGGLPLGGKGAGQYPPGGQIQKESAVQTIIISQERGKITFRHAGKLLPTVEKSQSAQYFITDNLAVELNKISSSGKKDQKHLKIKFLEPVKSVLIRENILEELRASGILVEEVP